MNAHTCSRSGQWLTALALPLLLGLLFLALSQFAQPAYSQGFEPPAGAV